jgi:hypothetical protein
VLTAGLPLQALLYFLMFLLSCQSVSSSKVTADAHLRFGCGPAADPRDQMDHHAFLEEVCGVLLL